MYSVLLKCIVLGQAKRQSRLLRTKGEAAEPSASTSEAASRLLGRAKGIKVTRIAQIAQIFQFRTRITQIYTDYFIQMLC